jgi:glutathione synthase/RimK-type ligase-like ATP-grasp enzyme
LYRVAIHPDRLGLAHDPQRSFSDRWIELLAAAGHEARVVDALSPKLFEQLRGCDGFLWWFPPTTLPRDHAKRLMTALSHVTDLEVFPDWQVAWPFDDKIAESYALQAAGIPTPRTWVFWRKSEALVFARNAEYPLVIKLATGYRSNNVALLRDSREAKYWIGRMFSDGLTALRRRTWRDLRRFFGGPAPEKNYFLVQEFVAGNAFDTRVTIIGDRVFAFRRHNRPGDFRASGSGAVDFESAEIAMDALQLALRTARALGARSLCVDILRRNGEPVVSEFSFFYEGWGVRRCPGHWLARGDELEWVEGQLAPEDAILADFLARLEDAGSR